MVNRHISSVADIFSVLGGNAEVARGLGVRASTASEMKRRGRIPAEYWRALIRMAKAKGIAEIDAEKLVRLHAREEAMEADGSGSESLETSRQVGAGSTEMDGGHFSRFKALRRSHFSSPEEIQAHIRALRNEWERR